MKIYDEIITNSECSMCLEFKPFLRKSIFDLGDEYEHTEYLCTLCRMNYGLPDTSRYAGFCVLFPASERLKQQDKELL